MSRFVWILLFALAAAPALGQEREWAKAQGEKFRAKFLRELDGDAVFLQGSRFLTVPLDDLVEADRKAIQDLSTKKAEADGPEADRPPRTPMDVPKSAGPVQPLVKPKTAVDDRDWTDIDGNRTFGRFVRVVGRDVLIRRGASPAAFPFDTLSAADQAYVNQVLTERGEQPLVPPGNLPPGSLPSDAPPPATDDAPPTAVVTPAEPDPDSADTPARQSQFYEELRRRQEERRQEQAEFAATNDAEQPPSPVEGDVSDSAAATDDQAASAPSQPEPASEEVAPRRGTGLSFRIDRKTLQEMKPVLVLGGALFGLLAVLGVIVYIATSIASSNTPHRQRKYY
jgi:hypothetical protein